MPFEIHYSPRSKIELEKIIEYISSEFGIHKAFEIQDIFQKIIDQIKINPFQFPYFKREKNIRFCVINHQSTLYYRIENDIIELISFRSNWMNTKTRKL